MTDLPNETSNDLIDCTDCRTCKYFQIQSDPARVYCHKAIAAARRIESEKEWEWFNEFKNRS